MSFCAFLGERSFKGSDINFDKIKNAMIHAIEDLGIYNFYFLERNAFCSSALYVGKQLKKYYTNLKFFLVITDFTKKIDDYHKKLYAQNFDDLFYPPIEKSLPKFRMVDANNWLVKNADYIVFYVDNTFSNSCKLMENAKRRKKQFENLGRHNIY